MTRETLSLGHVPIHVRRVNKFYHAKKWLVGLATAANCVDGEIRGEIEEVSHSSSFPFVPLW